MSVAALFPRLVGGLHPETATKQQGAEKKKWAPISGSPV